MPAGVSRTLPETHSYAPVPPVMAKTGSVTGAARFPQASNDKLEGERLVLLKVDKKLRQLKPESSPMQLVRSRVRAPIAVAWSLSEGNKSPVAYPPPTVFPPALLSSVECIVCQVGNESPCLLLLLLGPLDFFGLERFLVSSS